MLRGRVGLDEFRDMGRYWLVRRGRQTCTSTGEENETSGQYLSWNVWVHDYKEHSRWNKSTICHSPSI